MLDGRRDAFPLQATDVGDGVVKRIGAAGIDVTDIGQQLRMGSVVLDQGLQQ